MPENFFTRTAFSVKIFFGFFLEIFYIKNTEQRSDPFPQVALFERAWNLLIQVRTDRADREGHPMDVDPETGEVIETPSESPEKRSQSPETPSARVKAPSWYEVHPQSDFVELDPDEDLPF